MAYQSARTFLLKCVQAIGQKASGMASDAQEKLNEINLDSRRREIMANFPLVAMNLWQEGAEFPEELSAMLEELAEIDSKLTLMRALKYAQIDEEEAEQEDVQTELITEGESNAEEPVGDAASIDDKASESDANESNPSAEDTASDDNNAASADAQ